MKLLFHGGDEHASADGAPDLRLHRVLAGAQVAGANATVRVLMSHEMETGQRRDAAGKVIPAWHITEVAATHNGKPVMTAEWGPAVSKNPFLQFTVKGAKAGDKIGVTWKDNRGGSRTDEATVS